MVPSLFTAAGTFAARAESTEDCGFTVWSLPPDDPPLQAESRVRAPARAAACRPWRENRFTVVTSVVVVMSILPCEGPGGLWWTLLCQDFATWGAPRRYQ